jgi:DMSO reductase anchor subunit
MHDAAQFVTVLGWTAAFFGVAGTIASAFIYLVPARPAWNKVHTPVDFLVSSALIGSILPLGLNWTAQQVARLPVLRGLDLSPVVNPIPAWLALAVAILWSANHAVRLVRFRFSSVFEERATAELLSTKNLHAALVSSFVLALVAGVLVLFGAFGYAVVAAFVAVLLARYLFFVSVVPLNMALTFTRGGAHS